MKIYIVLTRINIIIVDNSNMCRCNHIIEEWLKWNTFTFPWRSAPIKSCHVKKYNTTVISHHVTVSSFGASCFPDLMHAYMPIPNNEIMRDKCKVEDRWESGRKFWEKERNKRDMYIYRHQPKSHCPLHVKFELHFK